MKEMTQEEKLKGTAHFIRVKRDQLLKDSDWTQLPDAPVKDQQVWAEYRKALRDLPDQANFPEDVKWPKAP